MKISVPGNLLLFGEYAVTQPEGKGIAAAVDCQALFCAEPAEAFTIISVSNEGAKLWTPASPGQPLLRCAARHLERCLHRLPAVKIHIDTSAFHYPDGRKKGFGSSAAVAVGVTYLVLLACKQTPPDLLSEVYPLSLAIHREFQEGRGSGYDVAASLFGGSGLFTGGALPAWTPFSPSWVHSLILIRGEAPTSTKNALKHYHCFQQLHPAKARAFFQASNRIVETLSQNLEQDRINAYILEAAVLNRWIDQRIGLHAIGPCLLQRLADYRQQRIYGKPLGAGGEIATALVPPENTLNHHPERLILSPQGLKCST